MPYTKGIVQRTVPAAAEWHALLPHLSQEGLEVLIPTAARQGLQDGWAFGGGNDSD
jgi:hypothetical protein